jgi:GT2 family glycosyltransferase
MELIGCWMSDRRPRPSEAVAFEYESQQDLVSIVIVCYNNLKLLRDLLPDIESQTYEPIEVVCVLNGGDDGTAAYLDDRDVRVVDPDENLWYAGGNNRGASVARGEYLFVLNPDTCLESGAVTSLVEAADKRTETAVFVPKVLTADGSAIDSVGMRFTRGGRFTRVGAGEPDEGQYDDSGETILFDGAASLIRRDAIEDVGLFDRRYKTFQECHDLALRLYRSGWRAETVPSSVIYHKGGGTYDGEHDRSRTVLYYSTRNGLLTIAKHYNLLYALAVTPLHVFASLKTGISLAVAGEYEKATARLRGLVDGLSVGIRSRGRGMSFDEQRAAMRTYPKRLGTTE